MKKLFAWRLRGALHNGGDIRHPENQPAVVGSKALAPCTAKLKTEKEK